MTRALVEVISDIFTYNGAVVEEIKNGYLEFLAPHDLCEILGLPEEGLLNFSYSDSSEDTILASYDSELFRSLEKIFVRNGRIATGVYPAFEPNISKLSKKISENVTFSNAIFNIDGVQTRNISYLLIFFKYTALSDIKQEGIISFMMNEMNRSCIPISHVSEIFSEMGYSEPKQNMTDEEQLNVLQSACSSASMIVQETLVSFIRSLERRLNRDIRRVYEYYETLKKETLSIIEKKATIEEYRMIQTPSQLTEKLRQNSIEQRTNIEKMIEDRTIKGVDKLFNKLDAIETERKWKIQDLISKYALKIEIEPVSLIRLETCSTIFWINIKRRLSTRKFPLSYNPIVRHLDPLPCEFCFYPYSIYYVCDDKLHIVCNRCYKKCPQCGKQFCSACQRGRCPKCGRK